jgi:ferritin-like metal-binding protein YciE
MPKTSSAEFIQRYLQDAIALEQTVEVQMRAMAKDCEEGLIKELFLSHADQTRKQAEELSHRLRQIGGTPSTTKNILAHIFGSVPRSAPIAASTADRMTQNLLLGFSIESSCGAMYEALRATAEYLGDIETSALAKRIQQAEQTTAQRFWNQIPSAAISAVEHERQTGAQQAANF